MRDPTTTPGDPAIQAAKARLATLGPQPHYPARAGACATRRGPRAASLALVLVAASAGLAGAGPMSGLTMPPGPLLRGLRAGLSLHGGVGGSADGADAVVGGGLGAVILEDRGRGGVARWRPRGSFGLDAGYRLGGRAEVRPYVTGFGVGPFTFGAGLSTLVEREAATTHVGLGLGPEIDAHLPLGAAGPVLQVFLRGEVIVLGRARFGETATLGVHILVNVL